jgi:hypothetical protein
MSDQAMFPDTSPCPMCGGLITATDRKCPVCGETLTDSREPDGVSDDGISVQEIRTFVGPRADYYVDVRARLRRGESRFARFNWAAFFLSGLWLAYRKMYVATFVFWAIIFVESIVGEVVFVGRLRQPEIPRVVNLLSAFGIAIVCGACGNNWYLARIRREINDLKLRRIPEQAYLLNLSSRGGTCISAALTSFALFFAVIFAFLVAWHWQWRAV